MTMKQEILIVEDDDAIRQQLCTLLSQEGFLVREAENGLVGLSEIRDGIPDLVISDLAMPIMNGIELVEEIVLEYSMLPVIILSDGSAMTEVARMLRLGVKDFLFKPIRNKRLFLNAVKSVLKDSLHACNHENDFCQQWFNLSRLSNSFTKELTLHLDELAKFPAISRELLLGLMPEAQSTQGDWHLNYHILQPANIEPLVLDYSWMQEGKLAFYLVDSSEAKDKALATTLMIRAFFNAFLRSQERNEKSLQHLVHKIGHAIKTAHYASPVKTLFAILNASNNEIELISTGMKAVVQGDESVRLGENEMLLGSASHSFQPISLFIHKGSLSISLCDIATTSFLLKIERSEKQNIKYIFG